MLDERQKVFKEIILKAYYFKSNEFVSIYEIIKSIVQKILVKRYPLLFKYQMSCHSPIRGGNDILHCGTCKKCSRILLLALRANYSLLGFNFSHIDKLNEKLVYGNFSFGYRRIIQHCLYLLKDSGILSIKVSEDYPYAEFVHIDEINAPLNFAPTHVLERLIPIYSRDARGYIKIDNFRYLNQLKNFGWRRTLTL